MDAPQSPSSPILPSPDPSSARPARPPLLVRLLRKRVVIPLLLLLLPLAAVLGYRQSHLVGLPLIDPPFEPLVFDEAAFASSDNAYPDYEAAGKVFVDDYDPKVLGRKSEDAEASASDDTEASMSDEDAPPVENEAEATIRVGMEIDRVLTDGWPVATDAVKRYVDLNGKSLEHYRRGAAKPRYVRAPGWDSRFFRHFEVDGRVRRCSFVDLIRSARLESEGDLGAAWEVRRAALRTSRHLQHVDEIGGYGSWAALDVLYSLPRWAKDERVDAALLRRALQDVGAIENPRELPSAALRRVFLDAESSALTSGIGFRDMFRTRMAFDEFVEQFLTHEREVARRCVRLGVENILPFVDRPLWEQPPIMILVAPGVTPTVGRSPWEPSSSMGLDSRRVCRFFTRDPSTPPLPPLAPEKLSERIRGSERAAFCVARFSLANWLRSLRSDETRFLLMRVLLCAEIVRRETGRYPARIEDLVRDDLLKEVPRDPWSPTGAPLRYRVDDDGHVTIWSLGPDLIDDGGEVWKIVHPPPWPLDLGTTSRPRPADAPPLG